MIFANDVPHESRLPVKRISDVNSFKALLTRIGPIFLLLTYKSKFLIDVFLQLSEVIRFMNWQILTFGKVKIFVSKTKLLENIVRSNLNSEILYTVYEFGVAHGFLTQRMLSFENDIRAYIRMYRGYDTFEGLPSQYRNFEKGSFSNDGKYPDIESIKLEWFKGFVEDTVNHQTFSTEPKIILFDLDLFLPTKHVLQHLIPKLSDLDILYFDEGFDEAEFSILEKDLIPFINFEYLGTTGQGIALRFVSMKEKVE